VAYLHYSTSFTTYKLQLNNGLPVPLAFYISRYLGIMTNFITHNYNKVDACRKKILTPLYILYTGRWMQRS